MASKAKKAYLTWLPQGEEAPDPVPSAAGLQKVGFGVAATPWTDDIERHGWVDLATELQDENGADVWVIAGRAEDFAWEKNRYALSLALATVWGARPLHVFLVGLDQALDGASLPTLLRSCHLLDGSKGAWAAKVLIAANKKPEPWSQPFRFDVIAHQMVGQWFEVGPLDGGTWKGALLGVTGGGEIIEHAVGVKRELPERTVLEYASRGIKAQIAEDEYEAWSVQNEVDAGHSYYVKVGGFPAKLLIGEHPAGDEAEMWTLALK